MLAQLLMLKQQNASVNTHTPLESQTAPAGATCLHFEVTTQKPSAQHIRATANGIVLC